MNRVYIGLGSNLDQPIDQIQSAYRAFRSLPEISHARLSSLYLTSPFGLFDQPDFINAVLELDTTFTPTELLTTCLAIEKQQGRVRILKNGPRTLDCDILLFNNLILETQDLIIPHPRMHERLSVLIPLQELAGDIQIPGKEKDKLSIHQARINHQSIERLDCQPQSA